MNSKEFTDLNDRITLLEETVQKLQNSIGETLIKLTNHVKDEISSMTINASIVPEVIQPKKVVKKQEPKIEPVEEAVVPEVVQPKIPVKISAFDIFIEKFVENPEIFAEYTACREKTQEAAKRVFKEICKNPAFQNFFKNLIK